MKEMNVSTHNGKMWGVFFRNLTMNQRDDNRNSVQLFLINSFECHKAPVLIYVSK